MDTRDPMAEFRTYCLNWGGLLLAVVSSNLIPLSRWWAGPALVGALMMYWAAARQHRRMRAELDRAEADAERKAST